MMKVRLTYTTPQLAVDEAFTGGDADSVVEAMKKTVAGRVNFALRMVVNAMSPLQFAREVVSRYNAAKGTAVAPPSSCAEFLQQGVREGIVTIIDP
jgi:hypothetical protein